MTLPTSGPIAMGQISEELSQPYTSARGLGDATTRVLLQKPSGAISLSDGYGKEAVFAFLISGAVEANLRSLAIAAGWNQVDRLVATATGNITSNDPLYPALTIDGSFQNGVTLNINAGVFIAGSGGYGGVGAQYQVPATSGSAGGDALAVFSPVTINNLGTIGGGGGGGGGGAMVEAYYSGPGYYFYYTGGGGGGGASGQSGGAGSPAMNGTIANTIAGQAGFTGSLSMGGSGGKGYTINSIESTSIHGGKGGNLGEAGSPGGDGAPFVNSTNFYVRKFAHGSGGAAGACITGNAYITWSATGSRLGAIYGATTY